VNALKVTIGTFETYYGLYETSAPADYDCGSIIVLAEGATDQGVPTRFILIPHDQTDWQIARNSSGLHFTRPTDDIPTSDIQERLYRRLLGQKET
jgi:hypothetical protein